MHKPIIIHHNGDQSIDLEPLNFELIGIIDIQKQVQLGKADIIFEYVNYPALKDGACN